jgi:hypothetical protein
MYLILPSVKDALSAIEVIILKTFLKKLEVNMCAGFNLLRIGSSGWLKVQTDP